MDRFMGVMLERYKRKERQEGRQEEYEKIKDWFEAEKSKGSDGFKTPPPASEKKETSPCLG